MACDAARCVLTIEQIDLVGVLKKNAASMQAAQAEFGRLSTSWTLSEWEELDWTKVKDLQLRNILDERKREAASAQHRHSVSCPQFLKHVGSLDPLEWRRG